MLVPLTSSQPLHLHPYLSFDPINGNVLQSYGEPSAWRGQLWSPM